MKMSVGSSGQLVSLNAKRRHERRERGGREEGERRVRGE